MSRQHLGRHLDEFCGRHNARKLDTVEQMARLAVGLTGPKLSWKRLKGGMPTPVAA